MRVRRQGNLRLRDKQPAGHAQMYEKLCSNISFLFAWPLAQIHHNRLSYPPHALNPPARQRLRDLVLWRLEGLWLAAGPYAHNQLTTHTRMHSIGNCLDLG